MQNLFRRLIVGILALLAMSTMLTACDSNGYTTETATPKGVEVYPAVGTMNGVVKHGISVEQDPTKGLTYTCAKDLKTVRATYADSVDYNGATIVYDIESIDIGTTKKPKYYVPYVTISFKGQTAALKPVSLIVESLSDVDSSMNTDEHVVNLRQQWINGKGITLNQSDFGVSNSFYDVRFCVKP